jgi:hypothetical protein
VIGRIGAFGDADIATLRDVLKVDVLGMMLGAQAAVRH